METIKNQFLALRSRDRDTAKLNPNEMAILNRFGYDRQSNDQSVILKVKTENEQMALEKIVQKIRGKRLFFILRNTDNQNKMTAIYQNGSVYDRNQTKLGVKTEPKDTKRVTR